MAKDSRNNKNRYKRQQNQPLEPEQPLLLYPEFGEPQLEERKPHPAILRRRRWKKIRWGLWLLLMVPVIYFVIQVFIILAPRMTTDVARLYVMTDSLAVTGQVVLDSQLITGGEGYPYFTIPNGQRVAAGAEVAQLFTSEQGVEAMDHLHQINEEIELLNLARVTVAEGGDMDKLLAERQQGLYGMLEAIEHDNYGQLDQYEYEVTLASNRMEIATGVVGDFDTRLAALDNLKAQFENSYLPSGTVLAPEVGYFVAASLKDQIVMDYETISALPPLELQNAIHAPAAFYGNDVMGHIVLDYKWYFFTTVPIEEADKFIVGDKSLHLSFPSENNLSMPVQVRSVQEDEQNGIATVELYCEYIRPEILTLRVESAQVIFGEQKGIRIEKEALRLVDVKNDDGSVSTYRGVYERIDNMVYFRRVEILLEDEFFYLIPEKVIPEVNELEMYDIYVVDPGGVELYDRKIL